MLGMWTVMQASEGREGSRHPAFDEYGEHRQPTGLGDI